MSKRLRINSIHIKNVKGIEELNIDFPIPDIKTDLDVFAIGSENGVGKTTILEAISLLLLNCIYRPSNFKVLDDDDMGYIFARSFIKSEQPEAYIEADFIMDEEPINCSIKIKQQGRQYFIHGEGDIGKLWNFALKSDIPQYDANRMFFDVVEGYSSNPLIMPYLLYFHSYRKILNVNPKIGEYVERQNKTIRDQKIMEFGNLIDAFKMIILRYILGRTNTINTNVSSEDIAEAMTTFQTLLHTFSNTILWMSDLMEDNSIQINLKNENNNEKFAFNYLSSGQKEIITMLFMIWYYTRDKSSIVLIDEPELHLNAAWQRDFVSILRQIAPNNQYIFSTHSEQVFESVFPRQRVIIKNY